MGDYIHVWRIRCKSCNHEFEHIFRGRDVLRPHVFNDVRFSCPICGNKSYDPVESTRKMTLEEWQAMHPDKNMDDLPDSSYPADE